MSNECDAQFFNMLCDRLGPTLNFEKPSLSKFMRLNEDFEKACIIYFLKRANGNQLRAATYMGVNRNTLRKMSVKYGIETKLFLSPTYRDVKWK